MNRRALDFVVALAVLVTIGAARGRGQDDEPDLRELYPKGELRAGVRHVEPSAPLEVNPYRPAPPTARPAVHKIVAPVPTPRPTPTPRPDDQQRWHVFTMSGCRLDRHGAINTSLGASYKGDGLLAIVRPAGDVGKDSVDLGAMVWKIFGGISYDWRPREELGPDGQHLTLKFAVKGIQIW